MNYEYGLIPYSNNRFHSRMLFCGISWIYKRTKAYQKAIASNELPQTQDIDVHKLVGSI